VIHAVTASHVGFQRVQFQKGFNVVLAERKKAASSRDTRNGLGKSTLVEIIHFCLGAGARKGAGLLRSPLQHWTFNLDVDLHGHRYTVSRGTDSPGMVAVAGDTSFWPAERPGELPLGLPSVPIPVKNWTRC
jgi:uncharacterized protein YydD (DUF2326 family)